MIRLFKYCSLFLLIIACSKVKTIETREIDLPAFSEVVVDESVELILTQDTVYSLSIEAAQKWINDIQFEVKDSVLYLSSSAKGRWLHPKHNKITLTIKCPSLAKLTCYESCNIQTTNPITSPEFGLIIGGKLNSAAIELNNSVSYIWNYHPCGGTIRFYGQSSFFKAWTTALLTVDAKDLICTNAFIENNAKNDVLISPTNELQYSILANGNIQLFSNPAVLMKVKHTGEGSIIQH